MAESADLAAQRAARYLRTRGRVRDAEEAEAILEARGRRGMGVAALGASGRSTSAGPSRFDSVAIKRTPDGRFALKGTGSVLAPGQHVSVPHKSGKGTVKGIARDKRKIRLISGPDKGKDIELREAAELEESFRGRRPDFDPIKHPRGRGGRFRDTPDILKPQAAGHIGGAESRPIHGGAFGPGGKIRNVKSMGDKKLRTLLHAHDTDEVLRDRVRRELAGREHGGSEEELSMPRISKREANAESRASTRASQLSDLSDALGSAGGGRSRGDKVTVSVPKDTALGEYLDEQGHSRRRTVTVIDPMSGNPLVQFPEPIGQTEIPAEWIKGGGAASSSIERRAAARRRREAALPGMDNLHAELDEWERERASGRTPSVSERLSRAEAATKLDRRRRRAAGREHTRGLQDADGFISYDDFGRAVQRRTIVKVKGRKGEWVVAKRDGRDVYIVPKGDAPIGRGVPYGAKKISHDKIKSVKVRA